MKPKLSVIICTYNRGNSLEKCLASLGHQISSDFEVVIVDGGSTDNTNQVIRQYSEKLTIRKVVETSQELSRVRDRGWREAKGELVAWIDDDVVVSRDWAKSLVEIFDQNPRVGGVSGPTIVKEEILKNRDIFSFYGKKGIVGLFGKFWNRFFLEGKKYEVGTLLKSGAWTPGSNFPSSLEIEGLKEVDYLEACNMTLRRGLIAKVGGFDYGYTKIGEWSELDLAMRIKELGHRLVFSSKVRVDHNISQGGVFPRRTHAKERMENFFKFYFRHIYPVSADAPTKVEASCARAGYPPKPWRRRISYLSRFIPYLLFLNTYWGYKALLTKNPDWLGGWVGTVTGLKQIR